MIKLAIWKRQRGGSLDENHPTIEEAIEMFRKKK